MDINYNKIIEIYGYNYIELIKENIEDVALNITFLENIGFSDTNDIFERYVSIFIMPNDEFKQRFKKLINKIGINYVEIIENDLSILENFVDIEL